jgi:hypothetical protein
VAIEFDMNPNAISDTNDPSWQHVGIHVPQNFSLTEPNEAYESPANLLQNYSFYDVSNPNNTLNGPNLQLDNGTTYKVTVEYSPALATSKIQLGWLRVFIEGTHKIVRPLVEVPIDGAKIAAMIGSYAYIGFTAGSSSDKGAPIYIKSWSTTIVPPSASNTDVIVRPKDIKAGVQGVSRIQVRDACNNRLLVGEDQDKFSASFQVLRSGRILTGAEIEHTFSTNKDGTYNLNYMGLLAAGLEVTIKFDNITIAGQPMQFAVTPGDTVASKSTLVIGNIYPVDANNVPVGSTNATTGLYMVAAKTNGKIVSRDVFTSAALALTWLNIFGANDIAAAVIGSFLPSAQLNTAFQAKGAVEFNKLILNPGASWAFLRTAAGAKKEHYVWAEPTAELSLQSTDCTLYAHSFGQDTQSPKAYINIIPDSKIFPAGGVFADGR